MRNPLEKNLLIIAYHFQPEVAVGTIRPKKIVKYLGRLGWKSHVLTIKEKYITDVDLDLEPQMGDAKIHRTSVWPTPLQAALSLRSALKIKDSQNASKQEVNPKTARELEQDKDSGWINLVKRTLISLNWVPDSRMGWMIPAIAAGLQIIRKNKITHILTTSPPFTCSIIGTVLAKFTRAKLIVDFRDPWTHLQDRKPEEVVSPVSTKIESWLEKKVVTRADAVVATTQKYRDALRLAYHYLPADKFHTIYNGYDQEDIDWILCKASKPEKFTLCYIGTFYRDRNPRALLDAVAQLRNEGFFGPDSLRINFVGHVHNAQGYSVKEMISEKGLEQMISLNGVVPYSQALKHMADSSALILMAPNYFYQIPAKTFEYLAFNKPILALVDEGATAELIRRFNAGIVVHQDDISGIKKALTSLYRIHEQGSRAFQEYDPSEFERSRTIRQMAELLEKL